MEQGRAQEQEFLKAFDEYSDALVRHCFFRISDRERAVDLVQDAFTKTWIQITKGETIRSFEPYLYHVLNNLIIDHYRKKKSSSLDNLLEDGFDPSDEAHEKIVLEAEGEIVVSLLENLSPKDRDIVVMRYIDDLPVKNIAKIVGESENAVSVRLHRAIKKLKSILDKKEKKTKK